MSSKVTRDHHRWTRQIVDKTGLAKISLEESIGSSITIEADGATSPNLILSGKKQSSLAAPVLTFLTQRDTDTAGQDDDYVGYIAFQGYNDAATPDAQSYASILATIDDATDGEESGALALLVASHDGGMNNGLVLTGGSVDTEVDVTIANGISSVTTIAGDMFHTKKAIFGDAGEYIVGDGTDLKLAASNDFLMDVSNDLTLDVTNVLKLDFGNGNAGQGLQFALNGTVLGSITSHHALTFFTLYENGGASDDDYCSIEVAGSGATAINTVDAASNNAHLNLQADGNVAIKCTPGGTIKALENDDTVFTPADDADIATKKYVDDNAGGTSYWIWEKNARQYTRYDNWYMATNTTYGPTSTQWNYSQFNSSSLPSTWYDNTNPGIVVPKDCTLKDWTFTGNFQTAQTYQFALLHGPHPTFGSAGNYSLVQVGATQEEASATAGILYEIGQTGLSVSLEKGDMLLPCWRRTTEDTSTYRYLEMVFSVVCEIS